MLAAAIASIATLSSTSDASVSIALTVDELARDASAFVRVTPVDAVSAWEDGRIVTRTRVRLDDVVAGTTGPGREIEVRTLGGTVGDVRQVVEGEARFAPGVPVYLFVRPIDPAVAPERVRVVGRAQGELLIHRDGSGRETVRTGEVGALVARRVAIPTRMPTGTLVTALDGVATTTLRAQIARAWEVSHGR